jgi:hypothetical protein
MWATQDRSGDYNSPGFQFSSFLRTAPQVLDRWQDPQRTAERLEKSALQGRDNQHWNLLV